MKSTEKDKITLLLSLCKQAILIVIVFSIISNILMLTIPLYTLQLYDRVLPSQSSDTLIYLSLLAVFCIIFYAGLEYLRSRVLVEVSHWFEQQISPSVLLHSLDRTLQGNRYGFEFQRDMACVKNFMKSPSFFALLDIPWFPIYLITVFIIATPLGFITLIGGAVLFGLSYANQLLSTQSLKNAAGLFVQNTNSADAILQQAEIVQALGMSNAFISRWKKSNDDMLGFQENSSHQITLISALSKLLRLFIQVLILGVGAYYAVRGELTGGAMIAASIISGRALAPAEQSISSWKEFFLAKEALKRIRAFVNLPVLRDCDINLPKPLGDIRCEELIYIPQGMNKPLLQQIHFQLSAGDSVAVLGPSGAGKSTLARLMLGIFPATRGVVRLDHANVYTWNRSDFGKAVGYLPQDNGLIPGTIKENIACLDTTDNDDAIIAAAKKANAHEMILHLPNGYDTHVNDFQLSGGQAKRVALARALYKNPCFIVLDEPETHLDVDGEQALLQSIQMIIAEKKTTLFVITRHLKLIEMMNKILLLRNGKMQAFGNRADILAQLQSREPS